jgi:hypothetical protein
MRPPFLLSVLFAGILSISDNNFTIQGSASPKAMFSFAILSVTNR